MKNITLSNTRVKMFIYIWYLLCFKKIRVPTEDDEWGHFVDLDE